jgi:hypothetical protein
MRYLNARLIAWARRKYKRFKESMQRAAKWLKEVYHDFPSMFIHWKYGFKP